ncbi:PH domain-containing protein [Schumannella soli]|uniref:PH domain-containing protein n=1 Tax=Schumannella soli TaxID=2590779 RepID=A0A506XT06_9MICO|nr:PH domain-containing protein [Schumannella soli]TPW75821.1 PH domain-containing protein [Schumannella soli]
MTDSAAVRRSRERLVLRSPSSIWLVAVVVAVGIFLLGDAIVRGQWIVALRALPWIALVAWLFFAVLVRPSVVVTRERLEIVNVWRRFELPWAAIDHLESRYQLRAHLVDGRLVRSWGAPAAGLDRAPRAVADDQRLRASGSRAGRAALPPTHLVIDRWLAAAAERDERAGVVAGAPPGPSAGGAGAVEGVIVRIDWWVPAVTAALLLSLIPATLA